MISKGEDYAIGSALEALLLVGLVIFPLSYLILPVSAETSVLTAKWSRGVPPNSLPNNWEGGMVIGDVDNDGFEEVVYAGDNCLYVLNGKDGTDKYPPLNRSDQNVGRIAQYSQPQMDDIDSDGRLEILVPLYYRPGLLVLKVNAQNTSLVEVWSRLVQSGPTHEHADSDPLGSCMSKPISADINGDGKSEIFIASQDVEPNGWNSTQSVTNYDGTITLFDYLGTQLAQSFAWRSCSGGLSLADTDKDGEFELYMGDRGEHYGDGSYGKGCRSFWARNLTQRWNNPSFLCSSQAPVLADVSNDGILDVVVSDQGGGVNVLNSTNGAFIRAGSNLGLPVHYQLTVYDIDGDGHLEVLCCDGDHSRANGGYYPDEAVVFDLVNWQVDRVISLGSPESNYFPYNTSKPSTYDSSVAWNNKFSPLVADIYDNGNNADGSPRMEIVTGANTTRTLPDGNRSYPACLLIFDNNYNILQNITSLSAQIAYPFVQDIDNDGKLEVVIQNSKGTIWAYETTQNKPALRIRSELTFFSELRAGAAVYVPKPWALSQSPLVTPVYPASDGLAVPITLANLTFKIVDRQGDRMSYAVTSSPDIGSDSKSNKNDGNYSVNVNGPLNPYTTYTWTVSASDGIYTTIRTYSFKTAFAAPSGSEPTQSFPTLVSMDGGNVSDSMFICYNQSTSDPDRDNVTNLYKWSVNDASIASLLMPFNTRNDTLAKDYSGNGNDGVVCGATWTSNGRVGGAYSFDGSNDYISISDGGKGYYNNYTDALNAATGGQPYHQSLGGDGTWNEITLEHWIFIGANSPSDGSWRTIAKTPSYEIGFRSGSANRLFGRIWVWKLDNMEASPLRTENVEYTVNSATSLIANTWYHVVLTYKSFGGLKLYINGVLDVQNSSAVSGSVMRSSGEPVIFGGSIGYFNGRIDEVKIFPYTLSAQQVSSQYQESKNGFSNSSTIRPYQVGATTGSILRCVVVPSDSQRDGQVKTSNEIVLNSTALSSKAYLVVRGDDNTIYYRIFNPASDSWNNWIALPGSTSDSPAAVVCSGQLHIVVRGGDGYSLWFGSVNLTDSAFSGWILLTGATESAPTLTSNGTHLFLIVRGLDNSIYYRTYNCNSKTWEGWTNVPGATCDRPAATVLDNKLHLVVRGFGTADVAENRTLWHCSINLVDHSFSGWRSLLGATPSAPTLTSSLSFDAAYLSVRGLDDSIYINKWTISAWQGWTPLASGATGDSPALTVTNDSLQIVVRGLNGSSLWHCNLDLNIGTQSAWIFVSGSTASEPMLTS